MSHRLKLENVGLNDYQYSRPSAGKGWTGVGLGLTGFVLGGVYMGKFNENMRKIQGNNLKWWEFYREATDAYNHQQHEGLGMSKPNQANSGSRKKRP